MSFQTYHFPWRSCRPHRPERWLLAFFLLLLAAGWPFTGRSATYHTSPTGDDANSGAADSPWQTVRRAIEGALPGDTVILGAGSYPEYPATVRAGTGESARITFRSEGQAVLRGWQVNHPYITLENLQFTGLSSASVLDAYIRVGINGDLLRVLRCTVRDGIKILRNDIRFEAATQRLLSDTGGFLAAGFAPGQSLVARLLVRGTPLPARNTHLLRASEVSDTAITVTNLLDDFGPVPIYLTGSPQYGMYLDNGSRGVVVKGCTFRNLSFQTWFVFGLGHTLEDNLIEEANGWDAMHFGGLNHLFRRNIIRDSPQQFLQISPDAMENFSPVPYGRVVFKNNVVSGFDGLIASQKGGGTSSDLCLLRNVFHETGWFYATHPFTRVENNTFVRCAKTSSQSYSSLAHPVTFVMPGGNPIPGAADAHDSIVRNNVFVDCGEAPGSADPNTAGWYEVEGNAPSLVADGNFVTGAPPEYPAKVGWPEAASLNGGNPQLTDLDNAFGTDGVPFTDDDGLRPLPDSRLVGSGTDGRTIGAYEIRPAEGPSLTVSRDESFGVLRFTWPAGLHDWTLESAVSPEGPWYGVPSWPVPVDGKVSAQINASEERQFFRLAL